MIRIEDLSKSYQGKKVVSQVSFEVGANERFILLGRSGSGKTTTLKMINRLIRPDSGRIWIDGRDSTALDENQLRRGIGFVIQNHVLFPHYTVFKNIAVVPGLLGWNSAAIKKRAEELLEIFGLPAEKISGALP